jgi:4'-phosphopantetheinyl transferase
VDAVSVQPAPADSAIALGARAVHVWCAALDRAADWTAFRSTLSADERDRADRFYFERDRRRYTCARAILRRLLARYLDVDPRAIAFQYGPHGKPALSGPFAGALTFNVSHSGEVAMLAIARGIELGVDVEQVRDMPDAEEIATRFFSPREVARLLSLPESARNAAFFSCWTRKEAYLKALGSGLARPLDEFDVTFAPGEPPRLTVPDDNDEGKRWTIHELTPADGYAAALVTDGIAVPQCWMLNREDVLDRGDVKELI